MASRILTTATPASTGAKVAGISATGLWAGFVRRVLAAQQAMTSRRTLLEMDARMLKDIGITHSEAVAEARRAPWDIVLHGRGRCG